MAVRDIVLYPDDRLRMRCSPVDDVTSDEMQQLISDMVETMYDAPGVGLAAPQVGVDARITVIDIRDPEAEEDEGQQLYVLVNPEIVDKSGSVKWEEGCLSIPGVFSDVQRAQKVSVRALDRNGEPYEFEAEDLLAVCVQHEIDHLDGVLFLDHLSRLKHRMALKTYKRTLPAYLEEVEEKKQKKRQKAAEAPSDEPEAQSAEKAS